MAWGRKTDQHSDPSSLSSPAPSHDGKQTKTLSLLSQEEELSECASLLRNAPMFRFATEKNLRSLCRSMYPVEYSKFEIIWRQGDAQEKMLLVSEGEIERTREIDGQLHVTEINKRGDAVGVLHLIDREPCNSTAITLTPVRGYACETEPFNRTLFREQSFQREVITSLTKEIRHQKKLLNTPLLEQHPKPTPYIAISVAAAAESFYRSGMNALLNASIVGGKRAALFPNMHIQIPARVAYINGFKGVRHVLENNVDPQAYPNPDAMRMLCAVTPGLLMTPVSSILEACNVGHLNPEPLHRRWVRGVVPRAVREIVFGVGLNQLSDYVEERLPLQSGALNTALASVVSGVIAGYLSHVPHTLSTLKLNYPQKSYWKHASEMVENCYRKMPASWNPRLRYTLGVLQAFLLPPGLHIRTSQIVGSFVILNGTIAALKDWDPIQMLRPSPPPGTTIKRVPTLSSIALLDKQQISSPSGDHRGR